MNNLNQPVKINRDNHLYYFYDAEHDNAALFYIPVDFVTLIDLLVDANKIFQDYYNTAIPLPTWKLFLQHSLHAADFTQLLPATAHALHSDAQNFASQNEPLAVRNPTNEDPSSNEHDVLAVIVETRSLINLKPQPNTEHFRLSDQNRTWLKDLITGKIKINQTTSNSNQTNQTNQTNEQTK